MIRVDTVGDLFDVGLLLSARRAGRRRVGTSQSSSLTTLAATACAPRLTVATAIRDVGPDAGANAFADALATAPSTLGWTRSSSRCRRLFRQRHDDGHYFAAAWRRGLACDRRCRQRRCSARSAGVPSTRPSRGRPGALPVATTPPGSANVRRVPDLTDVDLDVARPRLRRRRDALLSATASPCPVAPRPLGRRGGRRRPAVLPLALKAPHRLRHASTWLRRPAGHEPRYGGRRRCPPSSARRPGAADGARLWRASGRWSRTRVRPGGRFGLAGVAPTARRRAWRGAPLSTGRAALVATPGGALLRWLRAPRRSTARADRPLLRGAPSTTTPGSARR